MYSNTDAVLRSDVKTVVLEGNDADNLFIGDKVLPVFESLSKTGEYPKFTKRGRRHLNNSGVKRAPGSDYNRITRFWETDTYACEEYGLEELIDDSERKDNSRFFDQDVIAAKSCYLQMRIGHEKRVADLIMSTSSFDATAAAVDYTEANIATIAFHRDVLAACRRGEKRGELFNTVVMSSSVFDRVRRSTLAQNFIRGAGKATDATLFLTASDLAASLVDIGINQVLVGRAPLNSANQGQAYSGSYIWGDDYIWVGNVKGGDFGNGGAGRTINWVQDGELFVTESYREDKKRSDVIRCRQHVDEKIINAAAGDLIDTNFS